MNNIVVIGAGVMGHGIAQVFAQNSMNVTLYDIDHHMLQKAEKMIHNSIKLMVERKLLTEGKIQIVTDSMVYTTDLNEALKDADIVIEVVPEILELKWETFKKIESIVSEKTIIASNTSSIPLTELIKHAIYPERFLITHFFNPPQLVPLVEIIKSVHTKEQVVNTIYNLMNMIGKKPVILKKEVPGFIANRIQMAILREAFWLLENEVATAEDIDIVMKESLGFRYAFLGPLEGQDLSGINTTHFVSQRLFPELSNEIQPPEFLNKYIEFNKLGIRSGEGFYKYEENEGSQKIQRRDEAFINLLKMKMDNVEIKI